jgi:hypothetical protein
MASASLVVHANSIPYINNVLVALLAALQEVFNGNCRLISCTDVDSAAIDASEYIFVIGENLGRFKKIPGRRYIYFNFSVVEMLGGLFDFSITGIKLIRYKRRLILRKIDLFDAVLDYYPAQTWKLAKSLDIPVFGFIPWVDPVSPKDLTAFKDRRYDIGFVGGLTPRRQAILDGLRHAGLNLSPNAGVVAEDVAAQSRCTINIHMQRSNHLEIPRVMGALAASTLITEDSHDIQSIIPIQLIQTAPYEQIVKRIVASFDHSDQLSERGELARRWYCEIGASRFKQKFMSVVREIQILLPAINRPNLATQPRSRLSDCSS